MHLTTCSLQSGQNIEVVLAPKQPQISHRGPFIVFFFVFVFILDLNNSLLKPQSGPLSPSSHSTLVRGYVVVARCLAAF